jgi:uncharacterized protein YdeI (YjbR/CyaY-like superfamily)
MQNKIFLSIESRQLWRDWLQTHHRNEKEIWLIFSKGNKAANDLDYDGSVEEALCFGWVDSLIKHIDETHYARKFTPRKPGSAWSETNRRRFAKMVQQDLITDPGLAVFPFPISKVDDSPIPVHKFPPLSPELEVELKKNPKAWDFYQTLTPSQQNLYAGWIMTAKKEETRQKRLREAVVLLEQNKKLGLK